MRPLGKQLADAGISWNDFLGEMHSKKITGSRPAHLVPSWALDDGMCRAVILERLRRYVFYGAKIKFSLLPEQPLQKILEQMSEAAAAAREHWVRQAEHGNENAKKHLSYPLYAGRRARLIFLAYRLCYNAFQVSQELGDMTPNHVRQELARLNRCAQLLGFPRLPFHFDYRKPKHLDVQLAREMLTLGADLSTIIEHVGFISERHAARFLAYPQSCSNTSSPQRC